MARLQHPNIVQIFEVGEHDGQPYFSLEFVDGGSLAKKLDRHAAAGRGRRRGWCETLARAMHAAHHAGVVHRDLKPANVLLTARRARPRSPTSAWPSGWTTTAGQTHERRHHGHAELHGPGAGQRQQRRRRARQPTSTRSGRILYELLTGRPPFKAATPLDTVLQVVSDEPVPPRQLQPKMPRDLETICLKCLQKEPRKRYADRRGPGRRPGAVSGRQTDHRPARGQRGAQLAVSAQPAGSGIGDRRRCGLAARLDGGDGVRGPGECQGQRREDGAPEHPAGKGTGRRQRRPGAA